MEVFNIVKIILVLVLFGYSVWELVNKLKKQQKQIQNLNKVVSNIRSNDITKKDVEGIINSYLKEHLLEIDKKLLNYSNSSNNAIGEIDKNYRSNITNIYNEMNRLNEDLLNKIDNNRITNTRKITDGNLQSEY
jgi:DNA repair ATPase RecN